MNKNILRSITLLMGVAACSASAAEVAVDVKPAEDATSQPAASRKCPGPEMLPVSMLEFYSYPEYEPLGASQLPPQAKSTFELAPDKPYSAVALVCSLLDHSSGRPASSVAFTELSLQSQHGRGAFAATEILSGLSRYGTVSETFFQETMKADPAASIDPGEAIVLRNWRVANPYKPFILKAILSRPLPLLVVMNGDDQCVYPAVMTGYDDAAGVYHLLVPDGDGLYKPVEIEYVPFHEQVREVYAIAIQSEGT